MKQAIIITILLALFTAAFSQQTNNPGPALSKNDYLRKSKTQKTVAFVLLGVGVTSVVIAATDNEKDSFGGAMTGSGWLLAGGVIATIVSIPLFVSSAKNKKRGTSMSFNLKRRASLNHSGVASEYIPSLNLKIAL